MEIHKLDTWDQFGSTCKELWNRYRITERHVGYDTYLKLNKILYRGQQKAEWSLDTTLERELKKEIDVDGYMEYALTYANALESQTGRQWNTEAYTKHREGFLRDRDEERVELPCYDYLVYLRQHDFPSPLLDWTESPYIASFFAYANQDKENPPDRVAVYAFIDDPVGVKRNTPGEPMITALDQCVTTHPRHFAQKAWYTVATKWDGKRHVFCPHDDVFKAPGASKAQDVLHKITLPFKDRTVALRDLSDFNIDYFTLFQSEDMLVKSLAMKLFDMGGM